MYLMYHCHWDYLGREKKIYRKSTWNICVSIQHLIYKLVFLTLVLGVLSANQHHAGPVC